MGNTELKQRQMRKELESLKLFKNNAQSFRTRDLEKFEGTDYLQELSSEELDWYFDNCDDFLFHGNTVDAVRRDVLNKNTVREDLVLETYVEESEEFLLRLLKYYGDKRLVKRHLKEMLEDELSTFPEEKEGLIREYQYKELLLCSY